MANDKEASGGLEWRVTVPSGSSVKMESESGVISRAWTWFAGAVLMAKSTVFGFGKSVWKMGVDDPRKVIHGFKVGIALSLVSIFYYTRPLYDGVGGNAMWAVMTVVVVFEYTVGGCLYKGFNRAVATLSAGGLAVGIHWIASKTGERVEPVILSASVFLLGAAATFSRFIPTIKARFDYGITIFILTFSLVAVSGYRVDEVLDLAQQRLSTIAIGIFICLLVCILICPVWASEELHLLITRNMEKLAESLESCIKEYFMEDGDVDGTNSCSQKSQGYKCVLNSKASEDSQANLARWELAHGRFGFRHPWSQYLKVGAAMRYCAYCMEALNGCINSEIQAPKSTKKHLREVCMKLSSASSKVLKELSSSIKSMKRSQSIDFSVEEMSNAVEELHDALRSFPNQFTQEADEPAVEATEEKKHSISVTTTLPAIELLPLITVASLLIEISARIEGVVDAVHTLADLAGFDSVEKEKPLSPTHQEQQDMKAIQEV
ncbi:aluminum-activated malate transporter 10-like [Phoenix dactylifera]|uniref:Aluminum-activated malate transporter 10-like n=1 Tax=Phoenix dactylifera TaxID=42345 RepID=A0A8B7CV06_PHODC|nr:aluminum-activated malate transporter 10-like [Phoenix dactylifera]